MRGSGILYAVSRDIKKRDVCSFIVKTECKSANYFLVLSVG